jgi:hypothetical protein
LLKNRGDNLSNKLLPSDKLKEAYPKINDMIDRVDNLVGQTGDSNTEIVDSRYSSVKSKTFTVLKDRLDEAETDTQNLDTRVTQNESDISQLQTDTQSLDKRTTDLENRLDTVEKTTITISDRIHHIANTVYGQVSVELKGRTYTNLLGSDGDCEDTSLFNKINITVSLDSTNKVFGNNGIKITLNAGQTGGELYRDILSLLDPSKYYLISAYVKNGNLSTGIRLRANIINDVGYLNKEYVIETSFNRQGLVIQPSDFDTATKFNLGINVRGNETEYGYVDGIMINEITSEEYAEGTNALLKKYSYVNSTKSTNSVRIKSVGKNRIPPFTDSRWINENNSGVVVNNVSDNEITIDFKVTGVSYKIPINCKHSETVTLSAESITGTATTKRVYINLYDSNGNLLFNKGITGSVSEESITFPSYFDKAYILIYGRSTGTVTIKNLQLEEGSTATPYEPYKESVSYITLPDGVDGLHSLPNGVNDEVSDDGKLIKRVSDEYTLQSTDIIAVETFTTNVDVVKVQLPNDVVQFSDEVTGQINVYGRFELKVSEWDNATNIGKVATGSNGYLYFIIEKGTMDLATAQSTFAGETLIYQLAEPKIYELQGIEDLYTFDEETTFIIEPAIRFEAIADSNGQITIPHTEYPINFIESVKEKIVDGDSISYIDADYSQVDTTTIGGLSYGKKYEIIYHYPQELTTGPTIQATYPINTAATIAGLLDVQRRLQKELGSVWVTLLPLADKELRMYALSTIPDTSTATTQELGDKLNELINVWK